MYFLRGISKEIKKQLTNTPEIATKSPTSLPIQTKESKEINKQLEKMLRQENHPLVFLIGPFGSGKTTQIRYFLEKHPHISHKIKSFIKINNLSYAFSHLTSQWVRLSILLIILILTSWLIKVSPFSDSLPIVAIIAYFFAKEPSNVVYTITEIVESSIFPKHKLIIIEDLERSSLEEKDKWALLANLWQFKRNYLVCLGYSPEDEKEKLKMLEYALKLEGVIIELFVSEEVNEKIIKSKDSDFPFNLQQHSSSPTASSWLSLFTPRELLLAYEQVSLSLPHYMPESTLQSKQDKYISVCLELLCKKLKINGEFQFDKKSRKISPAIEKKFSYEQIYFIHSFALSIVPQLHICLHLAEGFQQTNLAKGVKNEPRNQ